MRHTGAIERPLQDCDAVGDYAVAVARHDEEVEWVAPGDLAVRSVGTSWFGVVEPSVEGLLAAALHRHRTARAASRLTLIVAPREAPLNDQRRDDEICSFLASPDLLAGLGGRPVRTWCFEIMRAVLSCTRLDVDIQIVHKPDHAAPVLATDYDCDVIIPHRGLERHLRLAVDSILKQGVKARIAVGLDQKARCAKLLRDVRGSASVQVYQMSPHPVGPYVARHHLGHAGTADYIAWQDSDDIALAPRLRTLIGAAQAQNAGVVGSHELRMDEVNRQVVAVRYPLDVSAALDRVGAGHQVLFPMTVVRRDIFSAVGGFSTHRIFSLDVNFWLVASLYTRIVNVDEFLYIRRRVAGSLTMRPDIGSHTKIRDGLRDARSADYRAVRAGHRRVEETSLGLTHRQGPVELRPLTAR